MILNAKWIDKPKCPIALCLYLIMILYVSSFACQPSKCNLCSHTFKLAMFYGLSRPQFDNTSSSLCMNNVVVVINAVAVRQHTHSPWLAFLCHIIWLSFCLTQSVVNFCTSAQLFVSCWPTAWELRLQVCHLHRWTFYFISFYFMFFIQFLSWYMSW